MDDSNIVTVTKTDLFDYPSKESLFRPEIKYAEYPFDTISLSNKVYAQVRETLRLMGGDADNYGSSEWNPLKEYVKPGDTVLIKPNMVMHKNHIEQNGTDCLYTNPSVVAAITDYVWIALKGIGNIIVGDAPMQECKFDILLENSGYKQLIQWYKQQGVNIEIIDFREMTSDIKKGLHVQKINPLARGKIIDLGKESEFADLNQDVLKRLRITNYNPNELFKHHSETTNEYYISDYVLKANVIINMPKPKSHRKAGATIGLKNFVGTNVRKEFLPHHTLGSKEEGGDEYVHKNIFRRQYSCLLDLRNRYIADKKYVRAFMVKAVGHIINKLKKPEDFMEGNWYGNDTICKTVLDINKIILYADVEGIMKEYPVRRILNVADMIVSGEQEGPVAPSPKKAGMIVIGRNTVCFDEAVATLMGFSKDKISTIRNARTVKGKYILCEDTIQPRIRSNDFEIDNKSIYEIEPGSTLELIPSSGWKNHIELDKDNR